MSVRLLTVVLYFLFLNTAVAQTDSVQVGAVPVNPLTPDSLKEKSAEASKQTLPVDSAHLHSPKKATIYSVILPGLGQAYNKKYWKIPIIYAGLGASGYFFFYNNKEYQRTRKALVNRLDTDSSTTDTDFIDPRYTNEFLQDRKNYFRRNRDLSAIIGLLVYVANIIDADVDAHLTYFNVDNNLSLQVMPLQPGVTSLCLSYRF
ncbi:MAG: DUF5683 domain-containing protein [Bacteroidota bacterium]